MANENKPLNEAKPNEPITAQRWNDMQVALRKEHIEHSHNGKWKDGLFSGAPLGADGLAEGSVITSRLADAAVTAAKLDPVGDFKARSLALSGAGDKLFKGTVLSVAGNSLLAGPLRVSPGDRESLSVTDGYVEIGGGGNPLRMTSMWSSFTDAKPNAAEISNDTNNYKALMIVGNRSGGGVRRIAMWDRVDVIGRLVVGPGGDAGLTVNGPIDGSLIKGTDLQTVTLGATGLATVAQLKVTGAVTVAGSLTVSDVIVAPAGLRIGVTASPMQAFNRVQLQNGALHMDGNPVYLRADVRDQYDLLRWNPNGDLVELGGFYGVNLGFTRNAANVVAPALTVREGAVDVGVNGNPLRFSTNWQNFPATGSNCAEISNDTNSYKTLMVIGNRSNDGSTRRVSVWDRLEVNGTLAVSGKVTASSYNIQYFQRTIAANNNGAGPRDTYIDYSGVGFVQVFAAFVVFNGFSLWNNGGNLNFNTWGSAQGVGNIPQHAYSLVAGYNVNGATVRTFCSESEAGASGDNTVLATLVVIGRTN